MGAVQEAYGIAKDEAGRQAKEWEKPCERIFDKEAHRARKRVKSVGH